MKEIDIDALLSMADKPQVANNASQIMEMLQKADEFLKQAETIMVRLDKMGLKPLIVRGLGVRLGIDAESPLKTEWKSPTHQKYIEKVNQVSEKDLLTMIGETNGTENQKS